VDIQIPNRLNMPIIGCHGREDKDELGFHRVCLPFQTGEKTGSGLAQREWKTSMMLGVKIRGSLK
jgi:hypothetical protein